MQDLDPLREFIEILNELEWGALGYGMAAEFITDDIDAFERLIVRDLGVSCSILVLPDGYAVVFYCRDFPRLRKLGLRFPGRVDLDLAFAYSSSTQVASMPLAS